MEADDVIEALINAHKARTFLDEHAHDIEFNVNKPPCGPCMRRAAAHLRGLNPVDTMNLACKDVQQASITISDARELARAYTGGNTF